MGKGFRGVYTPSDALKQSLLAVMVYTTLHTLIDVFY